MTEIRPPRDGSWTWNFTGNCPNCGPNSVRWVIGEIQTHTCTTGRVIDTEEKFAKAWREYREEAS